MGRRHRRGVQGELLASDDGGGPDLGSEGAGAGPPPGDDAPTSQAAKLRQARDLTVQRRLDKAVALYQEIVQGDSHNVKARNNLGVLYDELGHHELALEQFEAARALDPDGVEVLVNLASALGSLGRFDDAERELGRAQILAPAEIAVRSGLGILCFRRGLYDQAEAELRWVCDQDPEHGPAHFYRGEALNRLGRMDEALDILERAARLQPNNYRTFYTMGILFDRKNLREEAAAMYRKARELQER